MPTFAELERAFFAGQVLAVRGQQLAPAQFVAFARRFGPPEPHVIDQFHHPEDPNILILSNRKQDGVPLGPRRRRHVFPHRLLVPAGARARDDAVLDRGAAPRRQHAVRRPVRRVRRAARGDEAADRSADRGPSLRQPQRARRGEPHRGVAADAGTEGQDAADHAPDRAHAPGHRDARRCTRCPAARTGSSACPRTRRSTLLDELAAHATQDRYVFSFAYGVGDVVIWDNASLLHSATLIDPDDPRTLWRITVKEPALAATAGARPDLRRRSHVGGSASATHRQESP